MQCRVDFKINLYLVIFSASLSTKILALFVRENILLEDATSLFAASSLASSIKYSSSMYSHSFIFFIAKHIEEYLIDLSIALLRTTLESSFSVFEEDLFEYLISSVVSSTSLPPLLFLSLLLCSLWSISLTLHLFCSLFIAFLTSLSSLSAFYAIFFLSTLWLHLFNKIFAACLSAISSLLYFTASLKS